MKMMKPMSTVILFLLEVGIGWIILKLEVCKFKLLMGLIKA